jgi:peptidyl-prolyl cis-trans isomerase C
MTLRIVFLAAIWLLFGSASLNAGEIPAPGDPATATAIIASRGGVSLSLAEVDAYLTGHVPEEHRAGFLRSGDRILTMVGNLLLNKQLAAEARSLGIDRDPLIASQLGHGDDDAVLAKVRMERYPGELEVPDFTELARERYRIDPSRWVEKGGTDIRQIVISTNGRGEDAARKLADELHERAVADPRNFQALISEYSDDANKAETLGVMENMEDPRYTSTLRDAALALQHAGDVSPPISTGSGFQIMQLIRRTADRQKPFEEVRTEIVEALRTEWLAKQTQDHVNNLRNLPVRDVDEDLLLALQTRYGTLPEPPSHSQGKTSR